MAVVGETGLAGCEDDARWTVWDAMRRERRSDKVVKCGGGDSGFMTEVSGELDEGKDRRAN